MKKIFSILSFILFTVSLYAVVLPDGTDARISDIEMNDSGKIIRAELSVPCVLNTPLGKIEAKGEVKFNNEGKITKFTPSAEISINTPVGILYCDEYCPIELYDSGCISGTQLCKQTDIRLYDKVYKCDADFIRFNDNWQLSSCYLGEDTQFNLKCGTLIGKKETYISFYSDGSIMGLSVKDFSRIFSPSGTITVSGFIILNDEMPSLVTIDSSEGLETKYGKMYPKKGSKLSFNIDGNIYSIVPQDISIINYSGTNLIAEANKELIFDDDGFIKKMTVKGKNLNIFGWSFDFAEDDFDLIIYPNNKIYLPSVVYSRKPIRMLIDENNAYQWNKPTSTYTTVYCTNKTSKSTDVVLTIENATISHFTKKGYEDYRHCPLLFDENENLIGYRRAAIQPENFDNSAKKYLTYPKYNIETGEYENYTGDVYLK